MQNFGNLGQLFNSPPKYSIVQGEVPQSAEGQRTHFVWTRNSNTQLVCSCVRQVLCVFIFEYDMELYVFWGWKEFKSFFAWSMN